jgi:hypothetical protein
MYRNSIFLSKVYAESYLFETLKYRHSTFQINILGLFKFTMQSYFGFMGTKKMKPNCVYIM